MTVSPAALGGVDLVADDPFLVYRLGLAPDETCHSADALSPSILKRLPKVEGGAAE